MGGQRVTTPRERDIFAVSADRQQQHIILPAYWARRFDPNASPGAPVLVTESFYDLGWLACQTTSRGASITRDARRIRQLL
jgi:hypothetical protein